MTKNEFLEFIKDLVIENMIETGILASLTVSQAILESGWGLSGLTVKGNALFQRYTAVVGETDYKAACRAVHAAGYATVERMLKLQSE